MSATGSPAMTVLAASRRDEFFPRCRTYLSALRAAAKREIRPESVWFGVIVIFVISVSRADVPATAPAASDFELIPTVELVPVNYRHRLVQQLSQAEDNQPTWLSAINHARPEHREALAFLLVNMPEQDLKTLKEDFLLGNIELAYRAREATEWARAIPQEIFFRDVLPYANVDETRENWRKQYFDRFWPLVKDARSASDAAMMLNKLVFPTIKVKYHATKRQKPNQSPDESEKIGYASCTGLSIILSDACRSVGVPARLAGTPLWSDQSGNHTWTEVWDKQWYFVGSAEPGPLNRTWFVDNASKADPSKSENRIYAASFEITPTTFPMVWNEPRTDVYALDVTAYYTHRAALDVNILPDTHLEIRQRDLLVAASEPGAAHFELPVGEYDMAVMNRGGKTLETKVVTLKTATTQP